MDNASYIEIGTNGQANLTGTGDRNEKKYGNPAHFPGLYEGSMERGSRRGGRALGDPAQATTATFIPLP